MEIDNAVHEIRNGVFVLTELHTAAQDVLLGSKAVQPDVGTIHNGGNKPLVHRVINPAPEGRDERIIQPAEHAANAYECILDVSVSRIIRCTVAPGHPAIFVNGSDDTLAIEIAASFHVKNNLRTIINDSGISLDAFI